LEWFRNSINQITRELPAFTFNCKTGFLALSNNIPYTYGKLSKANKALALDGKLLSVFRQILGGLFSLQTTMGIGIIIYVIHGKEIGNFLGLFKARVKRENLQIKENT
jgi:hypothetical protein